MKRLLLFVFFVAVLMAPTVASGEICPPVDVNLNMSEQQAWWMVLLDFLLQLVVPVCIAVLTLLARIAVQRWGSKLDNEKQEAVIRLTDGLITAGVAFAEEQGRKILRVQGKKTEGARKLSMATSFIAEQLAISGLPQIAEQELTRLVESKLSQERARPDGVVPSDPSPA